MVKTADRLDPFPPEAFMFLRRGLDYTVRRVHGSRAKTVHKILQWLGSHDANLRDLPELFRKQSIPSWVLEFIKELGGLEVIVEGVDLHVGGDDLCWGLRDLAVEEWGLLAPAVLRRWGISTTKDFGRMVFSLVERGELQKQPQDDLADFQDVYDFDDAFVSTFKIDLSKKKTPPPQEETEE